MGLQQALRKLTGRDPGTDPTPPTPSTPGHEDSPSTRSSGDGAPAGAAAQAMTGGAGGSQPALGPAQDAVPAVPHVDGRADVAAAGRLAADGRWEEAVDALAEANRNERHPSIEVALVKLRNHAAVAAPEPRPRDPWPPTYEDPFPDVVGQVPAVDVSDLDAEVLGGAVAHHGALVVRGVFRPDQVERSVAAIEATHQHRFGEVGDGGEPDSGSADVVSSPNSDGSWFEPTLHFDKRHQNLRRIVGTHGGTWLADSPASTALILDELVACGVIPSIEGHLGERPYFSLQKSTLRRSLPENRLVAWHQDGSFLDPDVRTMNVWVALSPCGGSRPTPGLEVIPKRFDEILPVDGVMSPHSISYDLIDELAVEMPTVFPEFEAGDALLFDEHFVHRTHLGPDMTEIRYALECWFFAPSHQSPDYTPLLV